MLVVDDNLNNRLVLLSLLEPLGFDLLEAVDGLDALEITNQHQPDLIITDLVMPRLDGVGLIKAVRDVSALAKTPIIMISASAFGSAERAKAIDQSKWLFTQTYRYQPFIEPDGRLSDLNLAIQ